MTEFSFDFRSGGTVVLDPPRRALAGSGPSEDCFVAGGVDSQSPSGLGAGVTQGASGASVTEVGAPRAVPVDRQLHRHVPRASHFSSFEVDVEAVLGESSAPARGRLGATTRVDPGVVQQLLELTTAVCRVSIYFRSVVTAAFRPRGVGVGVATSVLFVFGGVTGRVRFGFRGQIVQKLSRQPGIGGGVSGGVARGFLWNQVGDQVGRDARIPGVAVVSVTTSLS